MDGGLATGYRALTQVIKDNACEKELIDQVLEFTRVEETSSV